MVVETLGLLVSGSLMVAFGGLFFVESKRGDRLVLGGFRGWVDKVLVAIHGALSKLHWHFGSGAVRLIIHFVLHRLLSSLVTFLNRIMDLVNSWRTKNRLAARSVRDAQEKTHLELIADHKTDTALTEKEKKKLKEKTLGKL